MRRVAAALCGLLVASCSVFGGDGRDEDVAAGRRFVKAWAGERTALAATITGPDAPKVLTTLAGLRAGGVVESELIEVSGSGPLRGTAVLRFADGGRVKLAVRFEVKGDRVGAVPAAVSRDLRAWGPLRVEAFGAPARGDIRSRSGTLLAEGPVDTRRIARPALVPTVAAIDQALEGRLGGERGRRILTDTGRVLADADPADGQDVTTSLDDAAQTAAEASLGAVPGVIVAVDPKTGGIRALAANADPRAPDRPPATAPYSPGSAFKIVTAAAALEAGTFEPSDMVSCPAEVSVGDRRVTNFRQLAYGRITFSRAFAVSCNTAFAQIGQSVGTSQLLRTARALRFRVADELDGPATISVPRSRAELAVWSYGAAGSVVSAVHMAGVGATVARGGTWVAAGWTDRAKPGPRALRASTASALVGMMEQVVAAGTGTNAAVAEARIAGKTGTADPEAEDQERSNAWFVGLAPSRDTRLVVVAFLPAGGIGGDQAARLVRGFLIATEPQWVQH